MLAVISWGLVRKELETAKGAGAGANDEELRTLYAANAECALAVAKIADALVKT